MINYYKNATENSHRQWQIALETDKPIAAKKHKEDYDTYKSMYEAHIERYGVKSK